MSLHDETRYKMMSQAAMLFGTGACISMLVMTAFLSTVPTKYSTNMKAAITTHASTMIAKSKSPQS